MWINVPELIRAEVATELGRRANQMALYREKDNPEVLAFRELEDKLFEGNLTRSAVEKALYQRAKTTNPPNLDIGPDAPVFIEHEDPESGVLRGRVMAWVYVEVTL